MRTVFAAGVLLGLVVAEARAEISQDSAFEVLPGCRAFIKDAVPRDEYFRAGKCAGILEGVVYMNNVLGVVCPPTGATRADAARAVMKYIERAAPERQYERFAKLVREALAVAWPCRR